MLTSLVCKETKKKKKKGGGGRGGGGGAGKAGQGMGLPEDAEFEQARTATRLSSIMVWTLRLLFNGYLAMP